MKKMFFLIVIVLLFSYSSFAQNKVDAYSKGSSILSAGYAVINIWKTVLEQFFTDDKITSTGPIALSYEYAVTKKISAGIALGYSSVNGSIGSSLVTERLTNFSTVILGNYHFFHSKKIEGNT